MDRKRIKELSRRAKTELNNTEPESQVDALPQKSPESQKATKSWKMTLGWEWMWFACSLLGSWLLANIMEIIVPAETTRLAIGIFVLIYAARLTVWSIKEMGKG